MKYMKRGDNMTKEEMRELIRKNLIDLRNQNGLNQTEIGKKVNKGKTAVASWEQGISLPDITTLYNLSKIYNVPMEYFYEEHTRLTHEDFGFIEGDAIDTSILFEKEGEQSESI